MKLLRKVFSLKCLLVFSLIIPATSFADSTISLTIANPAATNTTAGVVLLSDTMTPNVIYKVTCSLTVTGAAVGQTQVDGAFGISCPTLGNCCEFKKPSLNNLGDVGPKNGNGAYQAALNVSGTTTYVNSKVSQIGTNDMLLFYNFDTSGTTTINLSNCTATPVTDDHHHCCKKS